MSDMSRRELLAGAAASVAALGMPGTAGALSPAAGLFRYKLGSIELTALYDGVWRIKLKGPLIVNAGRARVRRELPEAFSLPTVQAINYTALLVNDGRRRILIDTGTAGQLARTAGLMLDNLAKAGVKPSEIDSILISHFHPDHINGIKNKDGGKVFPNAEIVVPQPEWTFWMDDANLRASPKKTRGYFLNARRIFGDLASSVRRFKPGEDAAPGIGSIALPGHTPGHTAYTINSGSSSLVVIGDAARLPALLVRHPDWQPASDMDGPLAVQSRRRLLDRAAADKMMVQAYHFPFPGAGTVVRRGGKYGFEPMM